MRIRLAALLFVLCSTPALASSITVGPNYFPPNSVHFTILPLGSFDECFDCSDGDPFNDFHLTVEIPGGSGLLWGTMDQFPATFIDVKATTTAPSFEFVGGTWRVPIMAIFQLDSDPSYQLLATGTIFGTLFQGQGLAGGIIGGMSLSPPHGWYTLNCIQCQSSSSGELLVGYRPGQVTLSQVPEPTSILLLGSGLAAVGIRRWRAASR